MVTMGSLFARENWGGVSVQIGSGFDVCSAVYGSIDYVRVSSEKLAAQMTAVEAGLASGTLVEYLKAAGILAGNVDASQWDFEAVGTCVCCWIVLASCGRTGLFSGWSSVQTPFSLPRGLSLIMADVRGGSETPSMVRKILAWKDGGGVGSQGLWDTLTAANDHFKAVVEELHGLAASLPTEEYDASIRLCASLPSSEWATQAHPVCVAAAKLAGAHSACRSLLRQMGEEAGVPVEPAEQCEKADATCKLPGVVACGVPGGALFSTKLTLLVPFRDLLLYSWRI
jgi:phosphomevalonate kinase